MNDYFDELEFLASDVNPTISKFYSNISPEYKITSEDLDTSCLGERTLAVFDKLKENFELYYNTREIGGESEFDFFRMLQSCLNRNADTYERQLEVYDDDIAKPILGRTETVTYDLVNTDDRESTSSEETEASGNSTTGGNDTVHHVEFPADVETYDVDKTRDKTSYGKTIDDSSSGSSSGSATDNRTATQSGTVVTQLSDLGVRPNYEMLNGFLENNKTYIQFFIDTFEECFAPRYRRVFI